MDQGVHPHALDDLGRSMMRSRRIPSLSNTGGTLLDCQPENVALTCERRPDEPVLQPFAGLAPIERLPEEVPHHLGIGEHAVEVVEIRRVEETQLQSLGQDRQIRHRGDNKLALGLSLKHLQLGGQLRLLLRRQQIGIVDHTPRQCREFRLGIGLHR